MAVQCLFLKMPFTFSHPAAILPLTYLPRRWYSLTGLVIGSVVPDFEYFLRMSVLSVYSHTLGGLFYFDLPLGLALVFIFHLAARDSLIDNLPLFLKKYLVGYKKTDWLQTFKKQWLVIMLSILVGAFTHILWDGFTHANTVFTNAMPSLRHVFHLFGEKVPVYEILQHTSTLVGLLAIFYAIRKLPMDRNAKADVNFKYWAVVAAITLAVAGIKLLVSVDKSAYQNYIIPPISGAMIAIAIAPFIVGRKAAAQKIS